MLGHAINFALDFALTCATFALIYKFMPRVRIHWIDVWVGAAASFAVVLISVYYSAQIFLMGAEFTWVYAHTFGSLKEQPVPPADPVPSRSQTGEDGGSVQK